MKVIQADDFSTKPVPFRFAIDRFVTTGTSGGVSGTDSVYEEVYAVLEFPVAVERNRMTDMAVVCDL